MHSEYSRISSKFCKYLEECTCPNWFVGVQNRGLEPLQGVVPLTQLEGIIVPINLQRYNLIQGLLAHCTHRNRWKQT